MYHRELVNHVAHRLGEGATKEQISAELRSDGWSEDDVLEAYFYYQYPEKLERFSLRRFFRSEMPISIVAIILAFAITAFSLITISFQSEVEAQGYSVTLPPLPDGSPAKFDYGAKPALSDPDAFKAAKEKFITQKASFIEVDLSSMKVRVWHGGTTTVEVPVRTKGREGSWWETPAGIYSIQTKEKRHLSGMGNVYMPWSMKFQGNFYIHGWPYYPDGTPVASTYSGGCIRLSNEDAEKIYKEVEVGTPILVYEKDFSSDGFTYPDIEPEFPPPSYMAADLRNNRVFIDKNSTERLPIASLTKLMTALVATEYINLDAVATVPKEAKVFTSKPRLVPGEKVSVYQLLFPLLMESSNEAAETIARHYGRTRFIEHMNEKAKSIGMTNTVFTDVSGASEGNVSTAEDLFMLAKYIYNNRSFIFDITSGRITSSAYGETQFLDLSNFNDFSQSEFFFGGKTGKTTAAKETSMIVFKLPVGGEIRPIVFIVLRSEDRKKDSQTLIDYTLEHILK